MEAKLIRNLDPKYYTSPEIFAREREFGLSRTWQYVGHESQLLKTGNYITAEIAGQNLFCIKGKDSKIRAFYNVCQHRAHELLEGEGHCRAIVCPYHNWIYRLDGRLLNGPNLDSVAGLDKSTICLTSIQVENLHGFLFVNLDPNASPMDEWFPNVRSELSEFVPDIRKLKPLLKVKVNKHCNWKVAVENHSECYHCRINHKTFSAGVIKPETYDIQPQGHCLRHTTECQNLDQMSYPVDVHANATAGKYSTWFLWPMFAFQVYPMNILNTYCWREISPHEVEVTRGWYSVNGEDSEMLRSLAEQDRQTTVEEDIRLVESVQRGMNNRGYTSGPLVIDPAEGVNSEHSIMVLQQWMSAASQPQ